MVSVGLVLGGCGVSEQGLHPQLTPPHAYTNAPYAPIALDRQWWRGFGVEPLNVLVARALEHNHDVLIAHERMKQARIQARISEASTLPQVSASASTSQGESRTSGDSSITSKSSRASLGVSYELDLWGKLEAQTRVAKASYLITQYDVEASRLSLAASVAEYYFQLSALQKRIELGEENLAITQKLLEITKRKEAEGVVTIMDVNRQTSTLLQARSSLLSLRTQAKQTASALAILVGETPQAFETSVAPLEKISLLDVGAGLPLELLERRPDMAAAKVKLERAFASMEVASAARFPSFSLTGSLGVASAALLSLSNPLTTSLSGALGANYTLFDGGVLEGNLESARSSGQEAVLEYEKTFLSALKEVEDVLLNRALHVRQLALQEEIVALERTTLRQSTLMYEEGAAEYATLLDAQQSFFQTQDQYVVQTLSSLTSTVELHKVLGGGWVR